MDVLETPGYMQWAKLHPRVRFELTPSGVPLARLEDFAGDPRVVDLLERGTYGHPDLLGRVASHTGCATDGIVLVPGASCGIFVALAATCRHTDTILVEEPVYDPITRVTSFLGLRVRSIRRDPETHFAVDVDRMEAGLREGTRAVVLTNLHNPSGQYIDRPMMADIAERCVRHDARLIVDEAYLESRFLGCGGPRWTAAKFGAHVTAVQSLTKVHGLAGLRIGWLLTGAETARRAEHVMDLLSVNNAAPSMSLAIQAYDHLEMLEDRFRRVQREGQGVYRDWLSGRSDVRGYPSFGAIFECLRLPPGVSSERFCPFLRDHYETQVTPGSFFGLDDHVRLGLVLPPGDLQEALRRLGAALAQFSP